MQVIIIILFILLTNLIQAQDIPSVKKGSVISTLRQTLLSKDSSLRSSFNDDLKDSLKFSAVNPSTRRLDSLANLIVLKRGDVASVTDSIKRIVDLPQDKVNQGVTVVQSRVDSLVRKITDPGEDIRNRIDEKQHALQSEINDLESKRQNKAQNIESTLQNSVSRATDRKMSLPDSDLQILDLDARISSQDLSFDESVPAISPVDDNMRKRDVPGIRDLKVPDTKLDIEVLTRKADLDIPDLDKLKSVSSEMDKINDKLVEAQRYEMELQTIKENGIQEAEKLPEEIENRVENIDEIKALNAEAGKVTEYQDIIQRYKDEKLLQEEIKRKAKQVANEKLSKFSPAIESAQQQIAKAKKLSPAVQSFKDILKKRPNEMKGKPFRQRFVPGMTIQTYNSNKFIFDSGVQAGYRVTGRLTAGLGYTYRLSVDKGNLDWVAGEGVSGYRVYTDFRLMKSFYVHGEFEMLNVDGLKQPLALETSSDKVYGSYFGIGKRYNVSRKVKGSIIGLYRVDYKGSVPGLNKVNVRIGFDLNLKKEKRKFSLPE
jgi:hypothetical protein